MFDSTEGISDMTMTLELEFDPRDQNVFYFSTTSGLFKLNRRESNVPSRLSTEGFGTATSLSMSDEGFLLAGFSCGSVA